MFHRVFAGAAVCALMLFAGAATAEKPPAVEGVREHDGFFLQLQYGGSYLDLTHEQFSLNGGGTGLNVLVGGSPVANLVLFLEVFAQIAPSPTLEMEGSSYPGDGSTQLTFTNIGPGIAYYFGSSNVYVSGMLGLASAELAARGQVTTAKGTGFRLGLGKEWWVSNQWGIGVAGNFFQANIEDAISDELTARSFGINFSATYH